MDAVGQENSVLAERKIVIRPRRIHNLVGFPLNPNAEEFVVEYFWEIDNWIPKEFGRFATQLPEPKEFRSGDKQLYKRMKLSERCPRRLKIDQKLAESTTPNCPQFWDRIHKSFPLARVKNPFGPGWISLESDRWVFAPDSGEILLEFSRETNDWMKPTQIEKVSNPDCPEIVSFKDGRWIYENSLHGVELALSCDYVKWTQVARKTISKPKIVCKVRETGQMIAEKSTSNQTSLDQQVKSTVNVHNGFSLSLTSDLNDFQSLPIISAESCSEMPPEATKFGVPKIYDQIQERWPNAKIKNFIGQILAFQSGRWVKYSEYLIPTEWLDRTTHMWMYFTEHICDSNCTATIETPVELVSQDPKCPTRYVYSHSGSGLKMELNPDTNEWSESDPADEPIIDFVGSLMKRKEEKKRLRKELLASISTSSYLAAITNGVAVEYKQGEYSVNPEST